MAAVTLLTLPLALAAREELTFTGETTVCQALWLTVSIHNPFNPGDSEKRRRTFILYR